MGLLAAAALVAVLFPPLRKRLLGEGGRRDKLAAVVLGVGLSVWGASLGLHVEGEDINVRAIGVLIAAILGGPKAGAVTGLAGGLLYATQVDAQTAVWVVIASLVDGTLAGIIAQYRPEWVRTAPRIFAVSLLVQAAHISVVGIGLVLMGQAERYLPAWPAHVVKLGVNAAGVTLFMVVAHVVVSREESRVALAEARAEADSAALESLRRRLEPHFLFNALTAIRATIRRDPERARELVSDLADLYRYLLSHPDDAPLRAEVEHASSYLAIERVRLGDERLRVEVELPSAVANERVPALLLQPLVENAVKHGIARHEGGGVVRVSAWRDEDALVIAVEDRGEGALLPPIRESEKGAGIALATLRQRLERRFGSAASIELSHGDAGARAVVRLPAERVVAPTREADVAPEASIAEARSAK